MDVQREARTSTTERDEQMFAVGRCIEEAGSVQICGAFGESTLRAAGRNDATVEGLAQITRQAVKGVSFGHAGDQAPGTGGSSPLNS